MFFSYSQCGTNGYWQVRMLFREHVSVNNEHVSMNKSFLEYFVDMDKIFGDVEEYFATCSWMNDIYG